MNSLVSIITPSYNASRFIEQTIQSVLAQTYQNWEMIIVDDGSKDHSVEIINRYAESDHRIKLIQNQTNKGAAETRNVAIRVAKGDYIAFLDSDDLWVPEKLEKQLHFMEKNGVAFSFSAYEVIQENGTSTHKIIAVPPQIDYEGYLRNTIIGCLTVVINRKTVGDFEMPNIKSSHDMALWLLIMKRGYKAYGLQENLAKYRLVATSNTAKKSKVAKDVWRVYRELEQLPLAKSIWCFIGYAFNAIKKRI